MIFLLVRMIAGFKSYKENKNKLKKISYWDWVNPFIAPMFFYIIIFAEIFLEVLILYKIVF